MNIGGIGSNYLENLKERVFVMTNSEAKNAKHTEGARKSFESKIMIDKKMYNHVSNIVEVQKLLDDLQNSTLISDKNSVNPYYVQEQENNAKIGIELLNSNNDQSSRFEIKVNKLPTNMVISSDNLETSKALGLRGRIEINGVNLIIDETDTFSDIRNKLTNGEDLNRNQKLDKFIVTEEVEQENNGLGGLLGNLVGNANNNPEANEVIVSEDRNNDGVFITSKDTKVKSFNNNGKIYLESKIYGEESYISFEGSTDDLLKTLGFINDDGNIKNLVQESAAGEIVINGETVTTNSSELDKFGVKIDFSKAIVNKTSSFDVVYDEKRVLDNIDDFISKYNNLVDYINNNFDDADTDITRVKYDISKIANSDLGISLDEGNFYEKFIETRDKLGQIVNASLQELGLISNDQDKIKLDFTKLSDSINDIRTYFEDVALVELKENISKFTGINSGIQLKKESAVKTLQDVSREIGRRKNYEKMVKDSERNIDFLNENLEKMRERAKTKELKETIKIHKEDTPNTHLRDILIQRKEERLSLIERLKDLLNNVF